MRNMGLSVEEAISEIRDQWMDIDGVEGIGQGKVDEQDAVLVFVRAKTPEIEKTIPPEYKGFTVKIIESGVIYAGKPQRHCTKKGSQAR